MNEEAEALSLPVLHHLQHWPCTASELQDALGANRETIYMTLARLEGMDLIEMRGRRERPCIYWSSVND